MNSNRELSWTGRFRVEDIAVCVNYLHVCNVFPKSQSDALFQIVAAFARSVPSTYRLSKQESYLFLLQRGLLPRDNTSIACTLLLNESHLAAGTEVEEIEEVGNLEDFVESTKIVKNKKGDET